MSGGGGGGYPGRPNPSSRAPSQGSGLLDPCELFVEVRSPLKTYNDTTDIFTLEPRRVNHLGYALYPLPSSEYSANV